jgi:hypothetical protein
MTNDTTIDIRPTQLSELNIRARAYASQLWQVPFAYLALAGVLLTQLKSYLLPFGLLFICFFGILVLIHMFFVVSFHNKTVNKIIALEKEMGLNGCTKAKPGGTVAPFMTLVFLGILSPLIYLFTSNIGCLIAQILTLMLIPIVLLLFFIIAYFICNQMGKNHSNKY